MSADTTPQNEQSSRSAFQISLVNPVEIFEQTQLSLANKNFLPTIDRIGLLKTHNGLFSLIEANVGLYLDSDGYSFVSSAEYHDPNDGYWNTDERQRLKTLLEHTFGKDKIHESKLPSNINAISIEDVHNNTKLVMTLGWENERERWLEEVKFIDQALRRDTFPEEKQALEDDLQYLKTNPNPLPQPVPFAVGYLHKSADVTQREAIINEGLLQLTNQVDFVQKLQSFRTLLEVIYNAVGVIKNKPQEGKLFLAYKADTQ